MVRYLWRYIQDFQTIPLEFADWSKLLNGEFKDYYLNDVKLNGLLEKDAGGAPGCFLIDVGCFLVITDWLVRP